MMTRSFFVLTAFALVTLLACPAAAQHRKQDMFEDQSAAANYGSARSDLFGKPTPYTSANKDMFDQSHDYSALPPDMFAPRTRPTPPDDLYNWPDTPTK